MVRGRKVSQRVHHALSIRHLNVTDDDPLCHRRNFYLLSLLYLPLAHSYLTGRRKQHVELLWQNHVAYDHRFLRNSRARALCDSLKFGVSSCHTLAWMDMLALQVRQQQHAFYRTIHHVMRAEIG